jgi:Ca-activated chloride channel homolog
MVNRSLLLLLPLLLLSVTVFSQAGRVSLPGDSRKNTRPAAPEATPTPAARILPAVPADPSDDGEVIKVNTQLVSVPVRVMDKKGRFIGGMKRENFTVFENGVEQDIELFSNEHQAFTVALVLDMSYSTTFKISEIQNSAIAFIEQLRPQDRVMVVSFDEEVHMLSEPTGDRHEIYRAIKSTRIGTGTSLYEAVDAVINERLRKMDGRKAVILFTDGVDTTSRRANDRTNYDDAMELDSLIYTIRYDTFADVQRMKGSPASGPRIQIPIPNSTGNPIPIPIPTIGSPGTQGTTEEEYRKAEEYLTRLTEYTGGRLYQASTLSNLAEAYSRIASELREFYSIGYYPKEDRSGTKRANVKIRVDQPGLVVRSRESYIRRKPQISN